jgi:tetratricopeptide (TPR) repeat protein
MDNDKKSQQKITPREEKLRKLKKLREERELLRMDPDFLHEYLSLGIRLGILLEDLQQYNEAEKEYREVIRMNPNDAYAHFNLGNLLKRLEKIR